MSDPTFCAPLETYTVLRLVLAEYRRAGRALPPGYALAEGVAWPALRAQERALLRATFSDWDIPWAGRLAGWRAASPLYLLAGDTLVGGVYLCAGNEFDADPQAGQLHYAYLDPRHQGRGLYRHLFEAAVDRAATWALTMLYLNSDRHLLPEVYLRWGAQPWRVIGKAPPLPPGLARLLGPLYPALRPWGQRARRAWLDWRHPPADDEAGA